MSVLTEASWHNLDGEEDNEGLIRSRGYIFYCFEPRRVELPALFLVRHIEKGLAVADPVRVQRKAPHCREPLALKPLNPFKGPSLHF